MTPQEWNAYKSRLANDNWTPWGKCPVEWREMLLSVPPDAVQWLDVTGKWQPQAPVWDKSAPTNGIAYRVHPDWKGPKESQFRDEPVDLTPFGWYVVMVKGTKVALCSVSVTP